MKSVIFFICLNLYFCASFSQDVETELVLVHTVFRHGERTTYTFYPTDPNKNNSFYPTGPGALTNRGKMGEYLLGQFLRNQYDQFIGKHYMEGLMEIRSTHTYRTQMSAQLVAAGLFPPSKEQTWNPSLAWQPIPVFVRLKTEEDLLHPNCERKVWLLNNLPKKPAVYDQFIKPYVDIFNYIEKNSGMKMNTVHDAIEFFFIVKTEYDMNMTVPSWVDNIYPEPLYSTASQVYSYMNSDEEIQRINAGYLLKKIITDSINKINLNETMKEMKMYLYSGHESTVGFLLQALNVVEPHIPPYGSAVIFELRKNLQDEYFIKLKYRDDTYGDEAVDLTVPGCNTLCPLQQFIELQKNLLPTVSIQEACNMKNSDVFSNFESLFF